MKRLAALLIACSIPGCASAPAAPRYVPQVRELRLTTVPLLSKELASVYPFLREDFAPGGVLEGKEIYAFVPSTLVAVEGDTLHFTLVNPEDDAHTFVLQGLVVPLPPQSVTQASYEAKQAGVFVFACVVPAHIPAMYGQLVVLPASVARDFAPTAPDGGPH